MDHWRRELAQWLRSVTLAGYLEWAELGLWSPELVHELRGYVEDTPQWHRRQGYLFACTLNGPDDEWLQMVAHRRRRVGVHHEIVLLGGEHRRVLFGSRPEHKHSALGPGEEVDPWWRD